MTNEEIKKTAIEAGADLVGIAGEDRWGNWPAEQNPRQFLPGCRSVIVVGRRVLRGALRGIEEGTNFYSTYGSFGTSYLENVFLPRTVYDLASRIEQRGHEAVPLAGGDVFGATLNLDCKALAHAAGLGETGKGGFFLTRQYGHRQRLAMVLSDLPLESDPLDEPGFCRDCDACLTACPLQAMSDSGAGLFSRNEQLCNNCQNGMTTLRPNSYEQLDRLAASCGRACLKALENRVENRFASPFRKRAVWSRDLTGKCTVTPLSVKEEEQA